MEIAQAGADLTDKEIHFIDFAMSRDEEKRRQAHRRAAEAVRPAGPGTDVAMPVLGTCLSSPAVPMWPSCWRRRAAAVSGSRGSPASAPPRPGWAGPDGDGPAGPHRPGGGLPLEEALDLPGTKVLMKSGRALPQVLEALESRGLLESSAMVQNCGLPGEQAAESLKDAPQSGSYFTTLLVP